MGLFSVITAKAHDTDTSEDTVSRLGGVKIWFYLLKKSGIITRHLLDRSSGIFSDRIRRSNAVQTNWMTPTRAQSKPP